MDTMFYQQETEALSNDMYIAIREYILKRIIESYTWINRIYFFDE